MRAARWLVLALGLVLACAPQALADVTLYGVVLYVVMNFVVMPLSRVGRSPSLEHLDTISASVIAQMVFGVVCVLYARRALARA